MKFGKLRSSAVFLYDCLIRLINMCKINCKVRPRQSSETAKFVLVFSLNFAVYTIFFRTKWTNFAVIFLDVYGVFLFCSWAELCSLFSIFPVKMDELCSIFLTNITHLCFVSGPNLAVYLVFFQSKWTNFAITVKFTKKRRTLQL